MGFHRGNSTGKMFTWELTINNIQQYGFDGMSAANWKVHESPKLQVTKKNKALCHTGTPKNNLAYILHTNDAYVQIKI